MGKLLEGMGSLGRVKEASGGLGELQEVWRITILAQCSVRAAGLGWPHPRGLSGKKIRAIVFLPPDGPSK